MNMNFKRKLPIPLEVKTQFPLTEAMAKVKAERDAQIKSILNSTSDKFLLIIGPCSADREDSDQSHRQGYSGSAVLSWI